MSAHIARIDIGALDGHHMFHLAESLAIAGETERALRMLEDAVDHNFYGFANFVPFLELLRSVAGFEQVLAKAAARVAAFSAG